MDIFPGKRRESLHAKHGGPNHPEKDWQRVQRRMILYLQCLDASAIEGIQLILEALKHTQEEMDRGHEGHPVTRGIQMLRRHLAEKNLFLSDGPYYGEWSKYIFLALPEEGDRNAQACIRSMPPVNRGSMVPEEVV